MAATERQPLSFDDAQILALESAAIMGHTTKAVVLGPDAGGAPLAAARLRQRVAERIRAVPRMRLRLADHSERPAWEPDDDLDLDWHVAEAGGAEVGDAAFRARVGELMGERLDHERPLWRLDVLALEGGRTGVVGRIHHALADGVTAIRVVGEMLFDEPGEEGGKAAHQPTGAPLAAAKKDRTERSPRGGWLRRLPGALRRELRPGSDTVLDRHIGPKREVAWEIFPLERLKAVGHAHGATLNDVVLAAIAGALRSWLGDSRPQRLRAQVPVCLHLHDGSAGIGNRDSFLNVDLPLDEPDPVERLRRVNAETSEAKLDHDADTLYAFFHSLAHFQPLYRGVTRVTSGPREFALSVSNVPGPPDPVTILGHEVSEFCSFAEPADRHALRVSIVSLGGRLAFGFCSDPEAIGEVERLAAALEDAVAELEQAA